MARYWEGVLTMTNWREFVSHNLIGQSAKFIKEIEKIPIIAKCSSSVLVHGETGTGKEVCVKTIFQMSREFSKSFVPVNCGAIPPELAENELFGHKHGAFTGASQEKHGLIQEAEGGTLFLDEIDSLPQIAQVKLLRFLQEKTYRPLGSTKECKANVRVIAAMNLSPSESIEAGRLRKDLYYRLNVVSIEMPPLRERRDDIPLLTKHFLHKHSKQVGRKVTITPEALRALILHDWPGNVRELEHVIERAVIFAKDGMIIDFPQLSTGTMNRNEAFNEAKKKAIEEFEKKYIQNLLILYRGNVSRAAAAAQKHRRAFLHLIRKHGIEAARYRATGTAIPPVPEVSLTDVAG